MSIPTTPSALPRRLPLCARRVVPTSATPLTFHPCLGLAKQGLGTSSWIVKIGRFTYHSHALGMNATLKFTKTVDLSRTMLEMHSES
jgi:hypothetical protein